MPSVLILCDMFPPAFGPRMGYLCKYLAANGWQTAVVTEHIDDNTFSFLTPYAANVTYIRYYKRKGLAGKIEWSWVFLREMLFGYKDSRIYQKALEIARQHTFDLILCSTYRTFPLRAARRLAAKTGLPLVADLRDIIEQYAGSEFIGHSRLRILRLLGLDKMTASYFRKTNIRVRNGVLRKAAAVTTVSPWHASVLKACNPRAYLIYNGYDPELFYPSENENSLDNPFLITYTGRLLSVAMRNPELLFQAIERLADEQIITPASFRVRWYVDGRSRQIIEREAAKYTAIAEYMDYRGYVPASEIPAILREASILLILANKTDADGPKGVMTTKLFEALAVEKPLLCVRGDEGCIEDTISRTRSGLSAHNADEVYDFIKEEYLRWQTKMPSTILPNRNEIQKFSRESQARQFMNLFMQIIQS